MKQHLFILSMYYDDGVAAQWIMFADNEQDVWNHILFDRKKFDQLYQSVPVAVESGYKYEKDDRGYTKKLYAVEDLTAELLKFICENSVMDGDSLPGVDLVCHKVTEIPVI